ncbi:MAG: hypothetical protein O7C75_03815 [Verrucomicrobia bacterium]|nr:hypothetical protein [Verrucomicrobiota bacterium]
MEKRKPQKGSVILPTLLIIMVIVAIGSTYLSMSFNEFKMAHRNQDLQGAINLAEGGIEIAMLAMKNDSWSGWTQVTTDHYFFTESNVSLGNGRTGTIKVYSSLLDESAPIIFAEGKITSHYGSTKKQIRLDLERKGLFVNGLTAKDAIDWSGNNVTVDSYSSDDGIYDSNTNRNDNGSVASLSIVDGDVSPGNGDIWGYVATGGGSPTFGPNGTLLGEDSPGGIDVDPDRIAYDFYSDFPNVSAPSTSGALTSIPEDGTVGTPSALTPTYYSVSSYSNSNNETLVIDGPVVFVVSGDWSTKGTIEVTANGSVEIYIAGDLDIGGNGTMNMTNVPSNILIYGTNSVEGGQTIKISGNGAIKAAIYAPNAYLEIKGGGNSGEFMGAAVAYQIKMTGNTNFHYDEVLANFGADGSYRIARWRELIDSDEKVPLDTPGSMIAYAVSHEHFGEFTQP